MAWTPGLLVACLFLMEVTRDPAGVVAADLLTNRPETHLVDEGPAAPGYWPAREEGAICQA